MHFLSLKFFSLGVFLHIFTLTNQLLGFRLANVENFFNVNVFFNCKYKYEYKQ